MPLLPPGSCTIYIFIPLVSLAYHVLCIVVMLSTFCATRLIGISVRCLDYVGGIVNHLHLRAVYIEVEVATALCFSVIYIR